MPQPIRNLSDGDILFREGDAADCAYLIETGKLEIHTSSEDGAEGDRMDPGDHPAIDTAVHLLHNAEEEQSA